MIETLKIPLNRYSPIQSKLEFWNYVKICRFNQDFDDLNMSIKRVQYDYFRIVEFWSNS